MYDNYKLYKIILFFNYKQNQWEKKRNLNLINAGWIIKN